jgi:hypothetical protein
VIVSRTSRRLLAGALALALTACTDGDEQAACEAATVTADEAQQELEELQVAREDAIAAEQDELEDLQLRAVERWAVTVERDPDCFTEEERSTSVQLLRTIEDTGNRTLD